ncbi:hypothetical protein A2U01_0084369, partial [Trifolium medium]|nr:hypothetical protein [Trifolium medium]
ARPAKGGDRN